MCIFPQSLPPVVLRSLGSFDRQLHTEQESFLFLHILILYRSALQLALCTAPTCGLDGDLFQLLLNGSGPGSQFQTIWNVSI